jgi:hypothetical protein
MINRFLLQVAHDEGTASRLQMPAGHFQGATAESTSEVQTDDE